MDFWRAVEIIGRRKWLIAASMVVAMALTWGMTRLTGSKWEAVVRFGSPHQTELAAAGPGGPGSPPAEESSRDSKAQAAMYSAMIKSRDVIEPALQSLKLSQLPQSLLEAITVEASGPRMFELQVIDGNPKRAEELANALADSFVTRYHSIYTAQAEKVVKLLEAEMNKTNQKIAETRVRLDTYRAAHQIASVNPAPGIAGVQQGSSRASDASGVLEDAIGRVQAAKTRRQDLTEQLAGAQAQLAQRDAEIRRHHAPTPETAETISAGPDPLLAQYEADLKDADQKLADLRKRYTDSNPEVKRAITARNEADALLRSQRSKPVRAASAGSVATVVAADPALQSLQQAASQLREEIAGYKAQLAIVESTIRNGQAEIETSKTKGNPLALLTNDLNAQMEARSGLGARLNSAHMAMDVAARQDPVIVMERVSDFNPPINMTAGRTKKLLIMAALGALILCCTLILALDSVDRRLRTVHEAEVRLPSRVIAAIPQPMGATTYSSLARATELEPQSLHAEAFRFLAMHLLSGENKDVRSLMVLSAKAEQGSTTTLTNLGITLAQAGQRVVLVDANVRTSELQKVFEVPNDYGFTDLMRDPSPEALERAMRPTTVENLSIITSGPPPHNAWEMFRSPNLYTLSQQLHEQADFVLYDTPSGLIFTDAINLAPVVDGAFLCVRAGEPLTGAEQRLTDMVGQAQVKILGSVMNQVPMAVVEGYDNYRHYYGPQAAAISSLHTAPAAITGTLPAQSSDIVDWPQSPRDGHDSLS